MEKMTNVKAQINTKYQGSMGKTSGLGFDI
jgi:hypothetical protein